MGRAAILSTANPGLGKMSLGEYLEPVHELVAGSCSRFMGSQGASCMHDHTGAWAALHRVSDLSRPLLNGF